MDLDDRSEREESDPEELLALSYDELRQLARALLAKERSDHTLQATALVHEVWLKLSRQIGGIADRRRLVRIAARRMKNHLIDYARHHRAQKRSPDGARVRLERLESKTGLTAEEILSLHEALETLDPRRRHIVNLRFFLGFTMSEIAETLDVSLSTVEGDWRVVRAFLQVKMREPGS